MSGYPQPNPSQDGLRLNQSARTILSYGGPAGGVRPSVASTHRIHRVYQDLGDYFRFADKPPGMVFREEVQALLQ